MINRFYLYGPPGAGKSTIGRLVAGDLALPFYDLDAMVESAAGRSVAEIIGAEGEVEFRKRESLALRSLEEPGEAVVSLGGGTLLDPENRAFADQGGLVVCLTAGMEDLERRLSLDSEIRPLVGRRDDGSLGRLLAQRAEHYSSLPLTVDTSGLSPDLTASRTQAALGAYRVRGMGVPYDVRVSPGVADSLGLRLRLSGLGGPIALVSDQTVDRHYGHQTNRRLHDAGYAATRILFRPGEAAKRLESIERIWQAALAAGMDRGSTVAALGGGVVGDLAGFAAATLMRGIPWVNLPTSLLAMADACVGGKSGINLAEGKNLVGAFHAPRFVLADPRMLQTLPEAEWRCGMAEVVKHGVVGDGELLDRCRDGLLVTPDDARWLISRAIGVKIRLIETDPWDQGAREALNFGHTIGHALEKASLYRLRHGEAVSIGMVSEARLAERMSLAEPGFADELQSTLRHLGLPTAIPSDIRLVDIFAAVELDKKRRENRVRFALPKRVGVIEVGVVVPEWQKLLGEE